jgi:hypothetical protein
MDTNYANPVQPGQTILVTPDVDRLHAIVGESKGYIMFVCETQPLTTMKSFGIPEKCCFCGKEFPTVVAPSVEALTALMKKS